jgi:hypothetical protein
MSAPTPHVRMGVYERDQHRCVSCGRFGGLTFQHRQAVGMGGTMIRPRFDQGLTACGICNGRYETDLQQSALRFGWKVPRWVEHAGMVPVFVPQLGQWFRLARSAPRRDHITHLAAMEAMHEVYGQRYIEHIGLVPA